MSSKTAGSSGNLQDIVSFDEHTLFIHGKRLFLWAAEFHPFRLPVPGLWLDVLHKIKALGYNAVSFYVPWTLLEGTPGHIRAEGIFDLVPFFNAAVQAGLYLIARPGPYINAEVSGGGLPGWLCRANARLRTSDEEYLAPAIRYMARLAEICAPHQITHGGPIVLFQVENEYTVLEGTAPLDAAYMTALIDCVRSKGIVVPLTHNDAKPLNFWSPGSGEGSVDIYGWDGYPFGYGPGVTFCSDPSYWPPNILPSKLFNYETKRAFCPDNPFFIAEFQGSSIQGWGSDAPQEQLALLLNAEFERVIYKELLLSGVRMLGRYMTYGGTNWGNLGFPGSTTSYDGGSAISEERLIDRDKFTEARLQAHFVNASPALLTSVVQPRSSSGASTTTKDITVIVSADTQSACKFYGVRHTDYTSRSQTTYRLRISTHMGDLDVPQFGNHGLTLQGRDARIHVSDYPIGPMTLVYCTPEIFTVVQNATRTVVVLYGNEGEEHEFAMKDELSASFDTSDNSVQLLETGALQVFSWVVSEKRRVIRMGKAMEIHLVSRAHVSSYWRLDVHCGDTMSVQPILLTAGYLLRRASIIESTLHLHGDIDSTTKIEVISAPVAVETILFNGKVLAGELIEGTMTATAEFESPSFSLPEMRSLDWRYQDTIPEITRDYDDSSWRTCDMTATSSVRDLTTPVSLYGGDYGYHTGSLIFRGHFTVQGRAPYMQLTTSGGSGYGHSVWLDDHLLGSYAGAANTAECAMQGYVLPKMTQGTHHTLTILIDHMGYDMQFIAHSDAMKNPRGILHYFIANHEAKDVSWKVKGNAGGEQSFDVTRGPLNEGALYAERQGWHLPGAPSQEWAQRSPFAGLSTAGVGFFYATMTLDLPKGYDIPLAFKFEPEPLSNFRCQLFVNGYHFGKYVNNLGPQVRFPVPEGILNYRGNNFIALTLWAMDRGGARLQGLRLEASKMIQSGYGEVEQAPQSSWAVRQCEK